MSGKKTRDGLNLGKILKTAILAGATIRPGTNHVRVLNYGTMRPCPIATSTHAKTMVAPWLAQATGRGKQEVYSNLREGTW